MVSRNVGEQRPIEMGIGFLVWHATVLYWYGTSALVCSVQRYNTMHMMHASKICVQHAKFCTHVIKCGVESRSGVEVWDLRSQIIRYYYVRVIHLLLIVPSSQYWEFGLITKNLGLKNDGGSASIFAEIAGRSRSVKLVSRSTVTKNGSDNAGISFSD